jgi:hypothetical protein
LAWSLAPWRRRRLWPLLAAAVVVVLAAYAPFIAWNIAHDWENFAFTFHTRQHFGYAGARALDISTVRFMIYALLLAALTWFVALRREPRVTLVAWTALPLAAVLFGFSFVTTTESYWIIGPAASVALGAGILLERSGKTCRGIVIGILGIGTAYATAAALFLTLPEVTQAGVFFTFPALRGPLASGVYVFAPLAATVSAEAAVDHDAVILTDRYETAAELRWYGVDSRIVVALPQQPQWSRWHAGMPVPQHALLVTFAAPLSFNPTLARAVGAAFETVKPLSNVTMSYAGKRQDVYYMIKLDGPRPNARELIPGL